MCRITDENGNEIKLTAYQRNEIYRKAKELKRELREGRLTKSEHWNATPSNVKKFMEREGSPAYAKQMKEYRERMRAIGADPEDLRIAEYKGQR